MNYTELKAELKNNLASAYLIYGEDRYLCFDALWKIENAVNIAIKDMNSVDISGESVSARDIVESANIYPFGDEHRLIVVRNFEQSKSKQDKEILQNYLSEPLQSTILVFFSPDGAEYFKSFKGLTTVCCDKIDEKYITSFIKNYLAKNGIMSSEEAIETLIRFCASDMTRITNELDKLSAYVLDTKQITTELIEKYVVEDKEYKVYELSEFISRGDAKRALELVDSFNVKAGGGFMTFSPLLSNYRRALFVAINKDKTTAELASLLGVKEFAIKMLSKQINVFSTKKLKNIVDMLTDYEQKIKVGEMKENIAIKVAVLNILNIRGKNV